MINIDFGTNNHSVVVSDLIALSNLENKNIDSVVISHTNNIVVLQGVVENKNNSFAICGEEIVKITNTQIVNGNTSLTILRGQMGTVENVGTSFVNSKFRSVVILNKDVSVIDWSFQDTMGNVTSTLFPVELSTGTITFNDNPELWSNYSLRRKFYIRNRKTMAFIFKGVSGKRYLKFSTMVEKHVVKKSKNEIFKITLSIKSYLHKWYSRELAINQQIKAQEPKEFFKLLFELNDSEVYYANGVSSESFPKIGNIHTKEFKTYADILKKYCAGGVRFCFDRLERVKIFSDVIVDNIVAQKTEKYNITSSTLDSSSALIYNTVKAQVVQKQTLMNFDDLDNKYVYFAKKIDNAIQSNVIITKSGESYTINPIEITNQLLFESVQLKDYVLFKDDVSKIEIYGIVSKLATGNVVTILPILQGDKDYQLFYMGKAEYLYSKFNDTVVQLDLYYSRFELPMVWKFTRKRGDKEADSRLMCPLLPKVDGTLKYPLNIDAEFGSAEKLKVGEYSGYIEEIDSLYGNWDNTKLLYNREIDQFNGTNPPIFVLSNQVSNIDGNNNILKYTKFDNSDLIIDIKKPTSNDKKIDASITMYNNKIVNSNVDIIEDSEISRVGNKILEVSDLLHYKVGDILIVNNIENPTTQELNEYEEVLKDLRYRIVFIESQLQTGGGYKYYIGLNGEYPKPVGAKKYSWKRFPNWSIVYVQEMYFRGNPVINYKQEVNGVSSSTNVLGYTSKELYDEKIFELNLDILDKKGVKIVMGYILDNFQATNLNTTKFSVPLSVFNGIDIELLDVINFEDNVYTKIGNDILWLVTGISCKASTNEVELKLLNLNKNNTVPYDISIKDVISYKPVEIPKYNHTGGEGDKDKPDDGEGGTNKDLTLGQFWLSKIPKEKFRAKIESFDGKNIVFKDFSGTDYVDYRNKLFPTSEFGINVNGEVIFMQSDLNYRAFIKKRQVYDTNEATISPDLEVSFLVTTSYTDADGTLYSRKVNFGDGDNFLKVDPITGVSVQGNFVIGKDNKVLDNDLYRAVAGTETNASNLNNGLLKINSSTIFDGNANFLSQGTNEFIRINGGSIDFYRDNKRLTNLKNIRFGSLTTNAHGTGQVSFAGFKQPILVLVTPSRMNTDKNIASFFCYSELVNSTTNTYKFYLGATTEYHSPPSDVTQLGTSISFSDVVKTNFLNYTGDVEGYSHTYYQDGWDSIGEDWQANVHWNYNIEKTPEFKAIVKRQDLSGTETIFEKIYKLNCNIVRGDGYAYAVYVDSIDFSEVLNITKTYDPRDDVGYTLEFEIIESEFKASLSVAFETTEHDGDRIIYKTNVGTTNRVFFSLTNPTSFKNLSVTANAETSVISDSFGSGVVNYIAMEIE